MTITTTTLLMDISHKATLTTRTMEAPSANAQAGGKFHNNNNSDDYSTGDASKRPQLNHRKRVHGDLVTCWDGVSADLLDCSCRVFVTRSLHLEKIKFFGFDMDYTLAGGLSLPLLCVCGCNLDRHNCLCTGSSFLLFYFYNDGSLV